MRKTKIISLIIFSTILLGTIGGVVAWRGSITEFEGATHGGCHGSTKTVESENGTLTLSITPSGSLTTNQAFTLQVTALLNFTEANLADYSGRVMIGLSGELGDNAEFSRSLYVTDQLFFEAEVPTNGSTTTERHGDPMIFDLIAPATVGTYDLVVCAISAANRSTFPPGYYNITFATKSISINVVAPAVGGSISGGILIVTFTSVISISAVVILKMRKRLRKREL